MSPSAAGQRSGSSQRGRCRTLVAMTSGPSRTQLEPGAPRLSVIGTGYLGATHAVCMAELGYEVLGLDVDAGEGRPAAAPARSRSSSPGCRSCCAKHWTPAGCASPPTTPRSAEFADVHFVCVGTPQQQGQYAADLTYVDAAFRTLAPHLTRRALVVGKSTVPAGTAARLAELLASLAPPAGGRAGLEPGVPARGLRGRGHPAPGPAGLRRPQSEWAEQTLRAAFAPVIAAGTPGRRHRLRHRRAGQGGRQLVPGHQDLLHQRDGRGLRGGRRGRHPAGRGARPRRPDRPAVPATPASASAAAACPRTSGPSWPAPASWASTRRWRSCARSTRSTCAAGPAPSTWPGAAGRRLPGRPGRGAGRGVQAQLRRHPRLPRAGRGRRRRPARATVLVSTTRRPSSNARRLHPELDYADSRWTTR